MPEQDAAAAPVLFAMAARHVAVVTLNRPEKRNAVNAALASALEAIVRRTEADPDIRSVVLTSSFAPVFCAGADLAAAAVGQGKGIETAAGGFAGFTYIERSKPWIAAVEGKALAGGCEIVLACDMLVASRTASFGLPEVQRGMMAGAGGAHRIGKLLPRNIANELLATGDPLDAEFAYRWGMVNRLTQPGEAISTAVALAERIAANAPVAVQFSLAAARESAALPDATGRSVAGERFAALKHTEDFKEGPRAFLEKRAPIWNGR
uniref:enoyl-CoA hydratase-related protein n=1 Tax=uncultured Sphingomonas sp. TaxID=158754 RepID=UPI0035CB86D2